MPDSPTSISAEKTMLRAAALAKRDALSGGQRMAAAQAIALRGLPIELMPGTVVAGYSPIRSEIDPAPLMQELVARGMRLALPVIAARDSPLGCFAENHRHRPRVRGAGNRDYSGAATRRGVGLCANGNAAVRFPESVTCAFFSSVMWSARPAAPLSQSI